MIMEATACSVQPETIALDHVTSEGGPSTPQTLSKSALKKVAKAKRFAAYKIERRAREKEVKKEKKRLKAEKRAAGELDEEEENKRRKKKPRVSKFRGKVVVDLGFDDMMTDKEVVSLCSQLAYTYSANRRASYPFILIFTSLNGRTFTRLESMSDAGYKRWANAEWWEEGYQRLWLGHQRTIQDDQGSEEINKGVSKPDCEPIEGNGMAIEDGAGETDLEYDTQKSVIYLTADSEEELTELKEDETYIIGGICDHNRYKNLCFNKAKDSGIRTARLPIGRYLASLPTRKVLTVNQVFEILLRWVETKDWEEALHHVVPKRKFQGTGKGKEVVKEVESGEECIEEHDAITEVAVGEMDVHESGEK